MANREEREYRSIVSRHFASRSRDCILGSLYKRNRAGPRAVLRVCASTTFFTVGLLLNAASYSAQYAAGGTIVTLRNHTLSYPNAPVQGVSILQLSAPFSNGCSWVFLTAADKNALAVILSAKALGTSIVIYYDNAITAPWGDPTTCAVVAIDYNS